MQDANAWETKLESELEGTERGGWSAALITFLNSSFGIWFLTSVAVGGGVWAFQQWRDAQVKEETAARRFDQLEFELEARTSQYLAWFAKHYAKRANKDYVFADGVNSDKLLQSLRVFGDLPRRQVPEFPYIVELSPDFKERSLLSLFVELKAINNRKKKPELLTPKKNRVSEGMTEPPSAGSSDEDYKRFASLPLEVRRSAIYARAIDFLVIMELPEKIDYQSFKKRFSDVFLTGDIGNSYFPYTDCFDC